MTYTIGIFHGDTVSLLLK